MARGPVSSVWTTDCAMPFTAASALPVAVGSVASASIRIDGLLAAQQLPRKSGGNIHYEQHLAPRQRLASRFFVGQVSTILK